MFISWSFFYVYFIQAKSFVYFEILFLGNFRFCFNSLVNGKYLNILIVAAFSKISFPGKTCFSVKNVYLLTTFDDKAEILAVCLCKSN